MAKFQNCLQHVLDKSSAPAETATSDAVTAVTTTPGSGSGSGDGAGSGGSGPELKVFDSTAALKGSEEIITQCVSEVTGVEILKAKSGHVLVCASRRILPKHTLVGGFGTGRCLG